MVSIGKVSKIIKTHTEMIEPKGNCKKTLNQL